MKTKKSLIAAFALGIVTTLLVSMMVVPGFAATVAKTITVYTGITLYYDGVEVEPKDANGNPVEPLLYNGTTYLPVRAISNLFNEDINWDGRTQSVYIGDMPGQTTYLGVDLVPYDKYGYEDNPTFSMDGSTYMNGFVLTEPGSSRAVFNLNGQYDTLDFDFGHVSGVEYTKQLLIYVDGKLVQSISINDFEMVKHVQVSLNGANQIRFELADHVGIWHNGRVGIANAALN